MRTPRRANHFSGARGYKSARPPPATPAPAPRLHRRRGPQLGARGQASRTRTRCRAGRGASMRSALARPAPALGARLRPPGRSRAPLLPQDGGGRRRRGGSGPRRLKVAAGAALPTPRRATGPGARPEAKAAPLAAALERGPAARPRGRPRRAAA